MALPAMISDYSKQQLNYGVAVGQSLMQLGQQVGQQLAMREYQKQATAALPAMQANYRQAFSEMEQGRFADGYMKMLETNMQFGADQNPFLASAAQEANKMFALASKQTQSESWRMQQAGGGGGGGMGGGGEGFGPTRRDVARSILLGEGPLPQDQEPVSEDSINIEGELPEMEGVADPTQVDPAVTLLDIANVANSPKFTRALIETAKNPPNQTTIDDVRAAVKDYFAKSEEERKTVVDSLTLNFPNKQQLDSSVKKEDRLKIDGANRILGKGYQGLVLQPAEEISSVTIGARGIPSETYKTNKDALNKFGTTFAGAVEELNQGSIGNFIANAGGVFNVEKEPVEEGDEFDSKQVIYFVDKRNKNNRIKIPTGKAGEAQLFAFDFLKASPAELSVFRNQGSTAGLYSFPTKTTAGPRKELGSIYASSQITIYRRKSV
jgi:hypothetical protein